MTNTVFEDKARFFDRWAPRYDLLIPSVFYQAVQARLVEEIELPPGALVLDIGCGTGKLLNRLAQADPGLTGQGVDLSPEMLHQAREKTELSDRLTFLAGRSDAIPAADNQFDAAFCTLSFLHYPDPHAVLGEVGRVLKPGGCFYWADYVPSKLCDRAQLELPLFGGIRFYSPQRREQMGQQAGLGGIGHHYLLGPIVLTVLQKP